MPEDRPWYGEKDLFEMILRHENKLTENTHELKITQGKIDRYNGLLERFEKNEKAIHACEQEILLMKAEEQARVKQLKSIKGWISFGITVITALIAWGVLS